MKNKKKKVVLVDIFFQHLAQTGIKTYTDNLLIQIEKYQGDTFTFIVFPSKESIKRSKMFKGKTARWKNLWFQLRYFFHKLLVLPVLSIWYKTDIVFSPDILSPIWTQGKRVSVIHDAFFWETPEHYNKLWRKLYLFLLQTSVRLGTNVITVSHYAKTTVSKYLVSASPLTAIPTGLDLKIKNLDELEQPPLHTPYFLHVGVMEKRKNLKMLIEAFAVFLERQPSDYSLVLVGQRGPREALDDHDGILSMVKKYQLEDKVIFTGYLSKEQLFRYYKCAEAYVFPSINEGFGLPVLEAFSFGLPVLIGPQGALQEVGGDAVLVSKSFEARDFASIMFKIIEDSQLRESLKQLGYERLSLFTGKKFLLSLTDYFNHITNE